MPGALAPAHDQQALGNEGAIQSDERHNVSDGAERDIVEQCQEIGLRTRSGPKAALTQQAVDCHHGHEHKPDGGEMTEAGKIVTPVWIDHSHGRRQCLVGQMVIDDDDVHAERARLAQRLNAGGAAIDGHQQRGAALRERAHGFDIRAIALEQAIGNVDDGIDAAEAQVARQQRRRGRAVHIVVAENRDEFVADDGVSQAFRRLRHAGEHMRIGHQPLDGGIKERLDRIELDVAAGEDARQQLRNVVALRNRQRPRRAALIETIAPGAAGRRAFHAEEKAVGRGKFT